MPDDNNRISVWVTIGIAAATLLLSVGMVVVSGVWVVGKIEGTTSVLTAQIVSLNTGITELRTAIQDTNKAITTNSDRISRIEGTYDLWKAQQPQPQSRGR